MARAVQSTPRMRNAALAVLAAAAVLAVAVPGTAAAQPGATPQPLAPAVEEKYDPNVALGLSLGATVAGYGAIVLSEKENADWLGGVGAVGVTLGPSLGHWYSGHILTRGLGLRALGAVSATAGIALALSACPIFGDHCDESPGGVALMLAGAGLWVWGTADDIITAPGEARRRNQPQLAIAPQVSGDRAGLALVGSF